MPRQPRKHSVVFLDRDGTLIHDRPGHYLRRPEKLRFYRVTFAAMRLLKKAGYRLVVITNQSGIGRGYLSEAMVRRINAHMRRELRRHNADLDAIYYCPHHPRERCRCRKPSPLMARRAQRELGLSFNGAVVIGDKKADVDLGRAIGASTVLLKTGHGRSQRQLFGRSIRPSHSAKNILDAARWVVKNVKRNET
ncbi:MAG: HAD family hydrolase [Elusimicrobiota bacterium]